MSILQSLQLTAKMIYSVGNGIGTGIPLNRLGLRLPGPIQSIRLGNINHSLLSFSLRRNRAFPADGKRLRRRSAAANMERALPSGDDRSPLGAICEDGSPWNRKAWELLERLRARSPLVQCITNFVSMDLMANVLLAAGASPAMVHSLAEIADFTPRIDALCINIGTLSDGWLPSMKAAASAAEAAGRPWVLDPVAVSASDFRMEACLSLVGMRPTVIRGNPSEIIALSSACRVRDSKGVDSSHESMDAIEAAKSLAQQSGAIVAVSGAVDFVTDGHRVVGASNGVPMMQRITATGCAVTALIAAFVAIEPSNALDATACALSIFGLAGELGMEGAKGPASLRMHMLDSLYSLDGQTILSRANISLVQ